MEGPSPVTAVEKPTPVTAADPPAAPAPDLLFSDTERTLATVLTDLLSARCEWNDVLNGRVGPALWHAVGAELGCAGLLIPESSGGAGASFREAAVAAEQLGAFVAPVPFLGSAVVATTALINVDASSDLLKPLAEGAATAALAVPYATAPGGPFPEAVRVGGSRPGEAAEGVVRLRGTVRAVADALAAGVLLVPAEGVPRGLYVVDADAPGVTVTPVISLDMTRQLADISFESAPARAIASGSAAEAVVDAALSAGAAMLAAEQVGLAQRCLDMTIAYVKERRQFARPVGSFQAIKHRLADLWVEVVQARAASRYAAACLAGGDPDARVAVALAKSSCSETAVHAAQECVQLHGGIGFTWEHPAHLYLKRAKATSIAFGTPATHRAALAALVDLPGPA
jgi:alkylation response protein AidB-like acyl-CoA dehydrogenase